ncbi:hypothetical protein L3Q82_002590 [Scortum barcoo]|uniref:Uncharacterized protein n=1 Tax=Scortum barcoo TaxID=214431 RepID=A0ACB8VU78_9TELE|nr:hypothetical protein L3Q82_002590 [Scortum barcoo]
MSKVLASRLREVMASIIHPDQTYCVPGRLISDNVTLIRDILEAVLVDFFWDRLHWVPQSILFLPKEEGGQGLVHLASRGAAFRLQFLQRLLTGPADLVWRRLSCCILQRCGGLRLGPALFLMDCRRSGHFISASVLQKCFLSVDFTEEAEEGTGRLSVLALTGTGTVWRVVELAGPRLDDPVGLAAQLGLRSTRIMGQILKHWRQKLTAEQFLLLNDFCYGSLQQNCEDPFPPIRLFPDFKNCSGPLLELADSVGVSLEDASGKTLYRLVGCFFGVGWWWGGQSGVMPVVSSQEELEKLTRRHAVKVLPQAGCSVEEVGSAVGEVVGFESASSRRLSYEQCCGDFSG